MTSDARATLVDLFVDGERGASASEDFVDVTNPSTGNALYRLPKGCEIDVNRAVTSARRAFEDGRWNEIPPSGRKRILHRWADLIASNRDALDSLDALEMGKPISTRTANAASAADIVRFYAEAVDKLAGDVFASDKTSFVAQRRVPRGVIGAVTPWNFPTVNAVRKLAPALAAGNSVVLKPSELASQSAMRLMELAVQAGLPPGVCNLVPGVGETAGRALGLHAGVDMLAFTGSTEVGKRMLGYAGESNMKVVMVECGGKSPHVLFDDGVDLDAATASIARQLLTNTGQICSVGSRLLVQRSIEKPVLEKIAMHFSQVVPGDPLDPRTTYGPLVSSKQCTRVMHYIEDAPTNGATLVSGGRRILEESGGYFIEPTLFSGVAADSPIAQEEIFGPVLAVIGFDDEAQAVRIANGTMYGLTAYVWTANLSRAMRMAKAIRSSIWINAEPQKGEGAGHAASFEPMGQSGLGVEGGLAGMESYLRRQFVCFNHA